jgi:hypothetical protein
MVDKMENPVAPIQQSAGPQSDIKERFYRYFQQECTELQDQIAQLENHSLIGGEKQDAIDHVLAGISRLSNEVSDSAGFIPAYDQRIYSQVSLSPKSRHFPSPNSSRPLKLWKRSCRKLDPNSHQKQDSSSRPRTRTTLPYLSTMPPNWQQKKDSNLLVWELDLPPQLNRPCLQLQQTS